MRAIASLDDLSVRARHMDRLAAMELARRYAIAGFDPFVRQVALEHCDTVLFEFLADAWDTVTAG